MRMRHGKSLGQYPGRGRKWLFQGTRSRLSGFRLQAPGSRLQASGFGFQVIITFEAASIPMSRRCSETWGTLVNGKLVLVAEAGRRKPKK
jgi:hypothetical protein